MTSSIPLDPDAEEARELLRDELSQARYGTGGEDASPTWLEDLLDALGRFFSSIGGDGGGAPLWLGVLIAVAAAVLVIAFLVFGLPRLRARSKVTSEADVFEADDVRDAAAMRRAADAAAGRGQWAEAIAERFRALARSLHERSLVTSLPGSTAHDVARRAGAALPTHASALAAAADEFDAVRYLGDPGDAARYERLATLDAAIDRERRAATEPELRPAEVEA
ncbi:DUF4129 domain-containing protein [Homoserinibacter sp. GY 40078]|uniref:DUF4129 domain-containing protein n=1 Tax=Homoserinibacter sp. GY 40078 TaxID=2603275 RepID=UPI002107325E|nr:DUF4129 domain-containing protein [Homoserinibacter sp. GY 40078]